MSEPTLFNQFVPAAKRTATKPPDELFEVLASLWRGGHSGLTKSARGVLNDATKQLKDVEATPAQVRVAWDNMRREWPNIKCTPSALVKHWGTFLESQRTVSNGVQPASDYDQRMREQAESAAKSKRDRAESKEFCEKWSELDPLGYSDARAEFLEGANIFLSGACEKSEQFFRWNLWDKHKRNNPF